MSTYLDTQVAVWLAQGNLDRISESARRQMEDAELLISPVLLLELEYLHEVKRILLPARDIRIKLQHELGVRVCDLDFSSVIENALNEKWTRDPFDRMIVAQAKANGFSHLVSSDRQIRQLYPRTVW